jgi:NAD(P)-dependent dehydrogenase (short-subunit alcohol dehydrogenase family)
MSKASIDLNGRVAIITGAGRGAGTSAAMALAEAGVKVCTSDINPDRAEFVAREIVAAGGTAFAWQTDVSNKFQVASLIETTRDRYGRLDILAQHAHINPSHDLLALDEWEWRRIVEVNLTGSFFCMQLAGRVMADEGGGVIALMVRPVPSGLTAAYAATQAGMTALAEALVAEWAQKGVRVAGIDSTDADEAARELMELCAQK